MQLIKTSPQAAIASENVGPDSAAGPVVTGLTLSAKGLFQARRRNLRNKPLRGAMDERKYTNVSCSDLFRASRDETSMRKVSARAHQPSSGIRRRKKNRESVIPDQRSSVSHCSASGMTAKGGVPNGRAEKLLPVRKKTTCSVPLLRGLFRARRFPSG